MSPKHKMKPRYLPSKKTSLRSISAQDPKWAIQGKTYESWEVFKQTLLDEVKASPKTPLMVAADKHAKVEDMLALLAFLQSQNIQTANLMMEAQ